MEHTRKYLPLLEKFTAFFLSFVCKVVTFLSCLEQDNLIYYKQEYFMSS